MDLLQKARSKDCKSVDIWYFDRAFNLRIFSIPFQELGPEFFTRSFALLGLHLAPLSEARGFFDPFLARNTLVFVTNLMRHKELAVNFQAEGINKEIPLSYELKAEGTSFSPLASNYTRLRNFQDEVVSALGAMGVRVKSFSALPRQSDGVLEHQINIQPRHTLELVDALEKIKYALLQVSFLYNVPLQPGKGVFAITNPFKTCRKKD